MATETLKIEISWPASIEVPEGATVNAQVWVGTETADYRMISDGDICAPAATSPATLELTYDSEDLQSDSATAWNYLRTSPYLMHNGKRLNIARLAKVSIEEARQSGWKIAIS
ncbi:hypothetical protein IAE39_002500 [Pseudomonas sp. S37]|uniref:hypothetical protein n=1 Tax=Pseudomonas sp. S37 TaxID=2767449 RepID=UPI0019140F13|nr:hypothetical protein [Pseudomonas sp. S37]MBK4994326.1 hypothetical protein [Pseudomonas sp. S37]